MRDTVSRLPEAATAAAIQQIDDVASLERRKTVRDYDDRQLSFQIGKRGDDRILGEEIERARGLIEHQD